jgi:hypothetical protein
LSSTENINTHQFAQRLEKLMQQHDPPLGIIDLSDKLQVTYEHARKMVRGISVPTRFIILEIADIFGEDAAELVALAKADNFLRKFGPRSPTPIFNPEVTPFAEAWPHLTMEQKDTLLFLLSSFVREQASRLDASPSPGGQ